MNALLTLWDQFLQDVSANERLRWGLFFIAVLGLIYTSLVLDDSNEALFADYRKLSIQHNELMSLEEKPVWQERVNTVQALLKRKEISVWKAESEALARANMQARILDFAFGAKLEKFNLKVGSFQSHATLSGVSTILFEMDASYVEDNVLDYLNAIESNEQMLKVVRLSLRAGNNNKRVSIMILAFFLPVSSDLLLEGG